MAKIKKTFILALFTAVLIGIPLSVYAADECDATISPEGLIHIPVVRYIEDLYTLDLQILDISGSSIELSIEKIAATAQDCPAESEITSLSPFTLNIASLAVGSGNYNITLSDDPGLKTMAPQLPGFLNMPYDGDGFNAGTGRHAIFQGSDGKYHIIATIKTYNMNSDVWIGKSGCIRDMKAVYPGGTATALAKAYSVKLTRDTTAADGTQSVYRVSEGLLLYSAEINYGGMQISEFASSSMSSSTGSIKMGISSFSNEATGTGTLNLSSGDVTTSVSTCKYSGTAYAEWLYIPSIVFSSSAKSMTEVMSTGRYIELNKHPGGCDTGGSCAPNMRAWHCTLKHGSTVDVSTPDFAWVDGDLTCTWSFKFYP